MTKQELSNRLQRTILDKFGGDKRKALRHIRQQCLFYAMKAERYRGTLYYQQWQTVYQAYSSAEFAISYYHSLDLLYEEEFSETD